MLNADDLSLEADLQDRPWEYPGQLPPTSGLLLGDSYLELMVAEGRRLGQARVEVDAADDEAHAGSLPLNYLLLRNNVAPVNARVLVVAIGSNAAPAVMRRKLARRGVSHVVPMVRGALQGIGVAHSAHVSASGYLAAAPVRSHERTDVMVSLVDEQQLACLDKTEPNYVRRTCKSGLILENGETPEVFYLYTSKWGMLARPGEPSLEFGSQEAILRTLLADLPATAEALRRRTGVDAPDLDDLRPVFLALGSDEALREELRDLFKEHGWTTPSGLEHLPRDERPGLYGGMVPTWATGRVERPDALVVSGTHDALDRQGEPCIVLHPREAATRNLGSHALVQPGWAPERPGSLARVVRTLHQQVGSVGVDQVVRNALGVEVGEHAVVSLARTSSSRLADSAIAARHYVVCRVQTADLASVEQPVCLLAPLAMSIIGVTSGDEVVVEGMPNEKGDVRSVRLKAHALPDDVRERRERIGGGPLDARFPSARDALAVYPDLPWMFLDSAARSSLGLTGKLAAVRVRASRRYQLAVEVRELILLLVIGFIGVATLVQSALELTTLLGVILLITLLLIRIRVRLRMRSRMTSSQALSSLEVTDIRQ